MNYVLIDANTRQLVSLPHHTTDILANPRTVVGFDADMCITLSRRRGKQTRTAPYRLRLAIITEEEFMREHQS